MPQGKNPLHFTVIWKGMRVGQFLRVCIIEVSFVLQNLICLIWIQVSHHHLDNHASFALTILLLLSGYSFSQVIEGNYKMFEVEILIRHMVKKKKDVLKVGAELAGFIFKPSTVVEAVNLKRLLCLPMAAFRWMRTIFSNLHSAKLFSFEAKKRELLNASVSYLHEAELSLKKTLL